MKAVYKKQLERALSLDYTISRKISIYNGYFGNELFKNVRLFLKFLEWTAHGVPWIIYIFILIYYNQEYIREFYINVFIGLLFDLLTISFLKLTFKRPRPSYNENDITLSATKIDCYSFPSGHATRSFMLFTIYYLYDPKAFYVVYILLWAFMVSLSRVVLGRHHISDVIVGIIVGIADAYIVTSYLCIGNRF
ncbi:polyisoprenoid diphosphate/phosphate phosphohydrolase PLPP6 [Hydra vulgaris]|uniref:Presqualene diphosphate phosphatase n=1 Tax=Hydra vulgaris TaxID=6087 RepID=T2MAD4_HYDVU|nr:polyisoprenoid diphosphate/phosphate phosphohydrolase PLPP6 [Hydra vulgaris]